VFFINPTLTEIKMPKCKAVVLQKINYSDSGIIVNLYTDNYGRIGVIVKGTRSRKSNAKNNIFAVLNILEIELDFKERRELQYVREAVLVKPLHQIHLYPEKLAISFFVAEVLSKTLREQESSIDTFNFITKNIIEFEEMEKEFYNFHLSFLTHLISYLGFEPSQNFCEETPYFNLREGLFIPVFTNENESLDFAQSELFFDLIKNSPKDSCKLKINNSTRRKMLNKIIEFYRLHIHGFDTLKSLEVLHEVLTS
jgi:DNA repair protein RecO (recombination protein O)